VLEDTDAITFNAIGMVFSDASVLDGAGTLHQQISQSADEKQERVSFRFRQKFKKGSSVKLSVGWQAKLNNSMLGQWKLAFCSSWWNIHAVDIHFPGYYLSSFEHEGKRR
jgi:hypothetical protein